MPALRIKDSGGTLRTISRLSIKDGAGTLRLIQTLKIKDAAGTLRLVYQYFTAAASPDSTGGSDASDHAVSITTFSVTATPTGGASPFTYLWSLTDTDGLWTADSPTSATSTFTAYAVGPGDTRNATATCVVTDANGSTATTNTVSLGVSNFGA